MVKVHPAANLFPQMSDDEYRGLKADIEKNGQKEPVLFWQGQLIDGRNRHRACEELGIQCSEAELDDDDDPIAWVISLNIHRRHLTASQCAMVGAKVLNLYKSEAKERQKDAGKTHGKGKAKVVETLPQANGKARDKAGASVKVSGRTIDKAAKVLEKGSPEVVAAVESGKISVSKAQKIVALPKEKQAEAIDSDFAVIPPEEDGPRGSEAYRQLVKWWGKADSPAKTRFKLYIDGN